MTTEGQEVPDRGDVVWVQFDPTRGHEQVGRRPALVISSRLYNSRSSLVVVCAMTGKRKRWTFTVPVKFRGRNAMVLVDQIRSIDREARVESVAGRIGGDELARVMGMLDALLFQ